MKDYLACLLIALLEFAFIMGLCAAIKLDRTLGLIGVLFVQYSTNRLYDKIKED